MEGTPLQDTPVASTFGPPIIRSKSAVNSRTSFPIPPNPALLLSLREVAGANGLIRVLN